MHQYHTGSFETFRSSCLSSQAQLISKTYINCEKLQVVSDFRRRKIRERAIYARSRETRRTRDAKGAPMIILILG